jgi:hypothetical protein
MNTCYEESCQVENSASIAVNEKLSASALFKTISDQDLFGDQGGYPAIHEGYLFMHEGRRAIPEIHGDDFLPEHLYQLDGCLTLEFEEA